MLRSISQIQLTGGWVRARWPTPGFNRVFTYCMFNIFPPLCLVYASVSWLHFYIQLIWNPTPILLMWFWWNPGSTSCRIIREGKETFWKVKTTFSFSSESKNTPPTMCFQETLMRFWNHVPLQIPFRIWNRFQFKNSISSYRTLLLFFCSRLATTTGWR